MSHKCKFIDLGISEYGKTCEIQEKYHNELINNKLSGKNIDTSYLIFCEHPHVYTLGKSGETNNLLINNDFLNKINATYFKTNRGGDITYHGPGQIVGYPIFNLEFIETGIKKYIYLLEESIIKTLSEYSVNAERLEGSTGVWLDTGNPAKTRKICAIGVRVSRSVTMHGFALNVNTDLSYFSYINPCGFIDKGVTSLQKELGKKVELDEVKNILIKNISELYNLNVT